MSNREPFIHPKALVDEGARVGVGTHVWAFAHVLPGAVVGDDCNLCDGVFVEGAVRLGNRVTVKCGVHLWDGVVAEDDVFIGPSAVFTNDLRPRSRRRPGEYPTTLLGEGCSIGANATILPGMRVGRFAMIAAGSVVTKDVPDFALVVGSPARQRGWVCRCGRKLEHPPAGECSCDQAPAKAPSAEWRRLALPWRGDERGSLVFAEAGRQVPFEVKRVYYLYETASSVTRGLHSHRKLEQVVVVVHGALKLTLDDGRRRETFLLDSPASGLYVPPGTWRELSEFSPGAVCLVLASDFYDEADYIRDYQEFLRLARSR